MLAFFGKTTFLSGMLTIFRANRTSANIAELGIL